MPTRWASLRRKRVSISNGAFCLFGIRKQYSHKRVNRAWDERPLCHVVPFRAFSTPRGTSVRCAVCGSSQRLPHFNVVQRLVVLSVVPWRVVSTLRGANARCADCGSGQRDSSKRSCSYHFQRGQRMPQLGFLSKLSPNTRLQRTPLRVE